MKGKHNGIEFGYSAQGNNGYYTSEYFLVFHHEQYTYVVKKKVEKKFPTKKEAEINAMKLAKTQIEKGLF